MRNKLLDDDTNLLFTVRHNKLLFIAGEMSFTDVVFLPQNTVGFWDRDQELAVMKLKQHLNFYLTSYLSAWKAVLTSCFPIVF